MEKDQKTLELIEKNKPLIEAHPFLVPLWGRRPLGPDDDPEDAYDGSYTIKDLAPTGWSDLIIDMCSEVEAHAREAGIDLTKIGVYDIKEKYGELNVAAGGDGWDSKCQDIVDSYCEKSMLVCPSCGKPTKWITTEGWLLFLCDDCANEAHVKTRPLTNEDVPYYTYYEYDEETQKPKSKQIRYTHHDAQFRAQWNAEPEPIPDPKED